MRILVGYDGSENAKVALVRATELTKNSDGELVVVVAAHVPIPAPYANRSYYEQLRNDIVEHARSLVAEASDLAGQAGVARVTGSVKEGFPADVIASYASETGADMIVLGRRGIRGVERTLMGSVSSSVLAQSKCDVLVVMG
jgi:nucleotide-binding universal stress UspA family protein